MLGKGNTAEVFEFEHGKVCKLFFEGYPQQFAEHEYQNAKEVFKLKLNIPKPFGLVTVNQRNGIIYEKVDGELLLKHSEKSNIDKMLDIFTKIHQEWLGHHSNNVLSYKEYLSVLISNKGRKHNKLMEEICALPDDDCILHGDFHPNNVLIRLSDGVPVVIDFMNVCYGPTLYDIARTFFLIKQVNSSFANIYLNKMNVSIIDISPYVNVIEQCRKYET